MNGPWFGKNLELCPVDQALVSLDDINFAYGYGVYETLKVRKGLLFFPELHVERLFHSASHIGLDHGLVRAAVLAHLESLVRANNHPDSNIKVLLIGRSGPDAGADLYVLELNPLFPKRHDYRDGAVATIFDGERVYPQAKTLNMLVSTIAYRQAQAAQAYDAVFCDRHGQLTEGTRTNLFMTDGQTVYTPPASQVLSGVTRLTVMQALADSGVRIIERPLLRSDLPGNIQGGTCSWFLTSTSTKIMPLRRLGEHELTVDPCVHTWMKWYDDWLDQWAAAYRKTGEKHESTAGH